MARGALYCAAFWIRGVGFGGSMLKTAPKIPKYLFSRM